MIKLKKEDVGKILTLNKNGHNIVVMENGEVFAYDEFTPSDNLSDYHTLIGREISTQIDSTALPLQLESKGVTEAQTFETSLYAQPIQYRQYHKDFKYICFLIPIH